MPDLTEQYIRNPQSNLGDRALQPVDAQGQGGADRRCRPRHRAFLWRRHERRLRGLQSAERPAERTRRRQLGRVLDAYGKHRKPNGDAIADLSLRNFVEMRDLVADPRFILRKKIEGHMQAKHPDQWLPLYSQVKFTDIPYVDALDAKANDTTASWRRCWPCQALRPSGKARRLSGRLWGC
jgi:kynurenine 3-monooxygenase